LPYDIHEGFSGNSGPFDAVWPELRDYRHSPL
jgi:hypothetical protein